MVALAILARRRQASLAVAIVCAAMTLAATRAEAASSWVTPTEQVASAISLDGPPAVAMAESGETTELWAQTTEGESVALELLHPRDRRIVDDAGPAAQPSPRARTGGGRHAGRPRDGCVGRFGSGLRQ